MPSREYDNRMILVVADDLLFRSKISTVAKNLGVVVRAATTPDAALARAAEDRPTLVLIDLDAQRPEPFEVLRRFAADQELRRLHTVGFVSHVHANLVVQARALGIGNVMARSAFVAELPRLLAPHAEPPSTGR
jgi:PleD family two-component response regulator